MLLNRVAIKTGIALCAAILMANAHAQPGEKGQRRGPPDEAFEACVELDENDACSVATPRGDMEGICIVPPRGEESLLCAPEGGPPADGGRSE